MNEVETPQRKSWFGRNSVLLLFAIIVSGFSLYILLFDLQPAKDVLRKSGAVVSKTLHDVMGLGGEARLAVEIELGAESASTIPHASDTASIPGTDNVLANVAPNMPPTAPKIKKANMPLQETSTTRQKIVSVSSQISAGLPQPSISTAPKHLVIAAAQIAGASSTDDFIKIFNPTGAAIDISGWKLRKRARSGTEYSIRVFAKGSVLQPQESFLWANSANGFASNIGVNTSSTETLAVDNSIALEDTSSTVIDALAWGSGHMNPFVEGVAYPADPTANQILLRKLINGIIQDTDNNAADFLIK
jgi:hypothetical protein